MGESALQQKKICQNNEEGVREDNKIKVLLINGNKLQSEYIATLFDEKLFQLDHFQDGLEAYEFLKQNDDLSLVVIISYQLKNLNGLDVMQKLNAFGKKYAFIFLTADKTVERAIEAMKAGSLDFIPKTGNVEIDLIPMVNKVYYMQQECLEQNRIKQELDEKNEELVKLSIVARETDNAVAIYNADLELEWINEAFYKLYGFEKEHIQQNKDSIDVSILGNISMKQNIDSHIKKLIDNCIIKKQPVNYTIRNTTKSGEKIWVQTTLNPVLDEQGNIFKLVTVDSNITELKKAEERIRKQKKSITDSINYAKRIQTSILPDEETIRQYFPESFIMYMPKDVVSGDFPWFFRRNDTFYVAAVDCTGHGVPGALLSFVGVFNLINIVDHDQMITSGEILDMLHNHVKKTLRQDREGTKANTTRDGMDIALCKIDTKKQIVEFSGAHRPLYMLHEGNIIEFEGDGRAIGGNPLREMMLARKFNKKQKKGEKIKSVDEKFSAHEIKYNKGDRLFMFSDGLPDQFKGEEPPKYSNERIREFIIANANHPINELHDIFRDDFNEWKAEGPQLDDVLLIGIQL